MAIHKYVPSSQGQHTKGFEVMNNLLIVANIAITHSILVQSTSNSTKPKNY